jgi:hypothetical protein
LLLLQCWTLQLAPHSSPITLFRDFDSPIYIDIFAKMLRRTVENSPDDRQVGITEMLPGPDHMWLPDAHDQRYASELRIVALDLER